MADQRVYVDWGDGGSQQSIDVPVDADGSWTWEGTHHYDDAGSYDIVVAPAGGPAGEATFVAQPSGGDEPAKPTLTVDDVTLTPDGPAATYSARVANTAGTSTGCLGRVTLALPSAQVKTWTRDGKPLTPTDVAGKAQITYGQPGFTIAPGMDTTVAYTLAVTAAAAVGDVAGTSEVLDETGTVIGSGTFTVTIDDGGSRGAEQTPDAQQGFDPAASTVAQVQDYVRAHPEQTGAVRAAEADGKARSTLLVWLDEQTPNGAP